MICSDSFVGIGFFIVFPMNINVSLFMPSICWNVFLCWFPFEFDYSKSFIQHLQSTRDSFVEDAATFPDVALDDLVEFVDNISRAFDAGLYSAQEGMLFLQHITPPQKKGDYYCRLNCQTETMPESMNLI